MALICFDIDGTVADIRHRLQYVNSRPKNWAAFDAGIPNDLPNAPVVLLFKLLTDPAAGHDVILASGRSETTRTDTVDWFNLQELTGWQKLYMRAAGDFRSDVIVKREILDQIVADYGKKPDMMFDDRPGVVNMWRENGVFVFDVYQGREDF